MYFRRSLVQSAVRSAFTRGPNLRRALALPSPLRCCCCCCWHSLSVSEAIAVIVLPLVQRSPSSRSSCSPLNVLVGVGVVDADDGEE